MPHRIGGWRAGAQEASAARPSSAVGRIHAWARRSTGLTAAAAVTAAATVTVPPIRDALGRLLGITPTGQVDFVSAMAVAAVVTLLVARTRQREAAVRAELLAREAQATDDLDRLVAGSIALTGALDTAQLRVEAWRHVPAVTAGRSVWMAVMTSNDWQWVIEPDAASASTLLELAPALWQRSGAGACRHETWCVLRLENLPHGCGLLAVDETRPLEPGEAKRVEWLAAMLGTVVANVQHCERLQVSCVSDALTGCFNRAHAFATLETELRRAKRTDRPVSILMLDVDGFKRINDEHGHLCGDLVLQSLGDTLRSTLRTSDIKCRYGGDEFLVILPETPPDGAEVVAEHLRRAVTRLQHASRTRLFGIAVSIGTASAALGETDALALVARADAALYREKALRSSALPRRPAIAADVA